MPDDAFGQWLKQRREELTLSRKELAQRIGYSPYTIAKVETGERVPSREVVERLSEILEIPLGERQAFMRFARGWRGQGGVGEIITGSPVLMQDPSLSRTVTTISTLQAPWRKLEQYPNNLPSQLNSFVGREKEIDIASYLLRRSGVRLLSLVGAPGIGKTRLALQVAEDLLDEFQNGVYLIPLAPLHEPLQMAATIAQMLGLREAPDTSALDSLKERLRAEQMLR